MLVLIIALSDVISHFFSQSVKQCARVCLCARGRVHLCVSVCWLELIIICRNFVCLHVHALMVPWQAESVCTYNEWGVSEAMYCIISLYSTPEGRKQREYSVTSH